MNNGRAFQKYQQRGADQSGGKLESLSKAKKIIWLMVGFCLAHAEDGYLRMGGDNLKTTEPLLFFGKNS